MIFMSGSLVLVTDGTHLYLDLVRQMATCPGMVPSR